MIVHPQMALYGGAETVIVHLAQYLKRHGICASIFTLSSELHQEYDALDIIAPEDCQIPYRIRGGGILHVAEVLKLATRLRSHIMKHIADFDVVNPHNFPAVWATANNKPVVWMCNEVPDVWHLCANQPNAGMIRGIVGAGKVIDRSIVNSRVSEAVVADEENARIFIRRYGWYPRIIPYGIEGEMFAQEPTESEQEALREKFQLEEDAFYIIQVGMISPSKNQLSTLRALRGVREKIPEVKVIFAGYREPDNHYTKILCEYVIANDLQSRVVFTGHVNKAELRGLYHIANLAVFSGGWQGSWLSPFEALSAQKPVIVSPSILCSSLIRRENIGVVSDLLDESILDVHENYANYLMMAAKGKQFVLRHLTWEKFCERFTDTLAGVMRQ